jgi:hypothetical protein
MNIPSIEELAISAHKDLIEKLKEVEVLKNNPLKDKDYIVNYISQQMIHSKEKEIEKLKNILSKYTVTIRDEKLNQLRNMKLQDQINKILL